MRFLADAGFPKAGIEHLRRRGHDVLALLDEGLERLPDEDVLALARQEQRILLTFDLDFGGLLAGGREPLPSVITFRVRDQRPAAVLARLAGVLAEAGDALLAGAVVIVEDARYRLRRLPLG